MKSLRLLGVITSFLMVLNSAHAAQTYFCNEDVVVFRENNIITISNEYISRSWMLTDFGMVTISVLNRQTGQEWANIHPVIPCDWQYKGFIDGTQKAVLRSIHVSESTDEGFTSKHVETVFDFDYPTIHASVKYIVWVYPHTGGIRTQVYVKGDGTKIVCDEKPQLQGPIIRVRNGKIFKGGSIKKQLDNCLVHPQCVQLQISNLTPSKKYKVGLSIGRDSLFQRDYYLRLSTVDGETSTKYALRGNRHDNLFDVPANLYVDGSMKVFIDTTNPQDSVFLSELWIYETRDLSSIELPRSSDRIRELQNSTSLGYVLSAYRDCGEDVPSETHPERGRADYLPIDARRMRRTYIGYYNDTQFRNSPETPIMKQIVKSDSFSWEENNWSSLCVFEKDQEGLIWVKESHKCVNQYGVDTGSFILDSEGAYNTGTSLLPEEIVPDTYKWFWGSWVIPYSGDDTHMQFALKKFDRKRYPISVDRDMYSLVCTWGHCKDQREGRNAAMEEEVLKEMDFVKQIHADLLLIDDGWQVSQTANSYIPDEKQGWRPAPSVYERGWERVRKKADSLQLRLGLWGVAQLMPASDMIWNFERLRMSQLKLDFATFGSHDKLSAMMDSVRLYIKSTGHKSSISWDLTENHARYGYYWAREYGNLHFMNRKPFSPKNVLYVPYLALRDFWLLSHYSNLNKYQLVIQHAKLTDPSTDAHLYSEEYCVATALMGIPEFMAIPRYYTPEDRIKVGKLMALYKQHQKALFTGYVFPIGEEPNNRSWTGFESILNDDENSGYFLLFRELHNNENNKKIKVKMLNPGDRIVIQNLCTGQVYESVIDSNGYLLFSIKKAADFLFCKWMKK